MDMAGKLNYRIFHSYDVGDQGVSILAGSDFDVIRAAVYIQFKVAGLSLLVVLAIRIILVDSL